MTALEIAERFCPESLAQWRAAQQAVEDHQTSAQGKRANSWFGTPTPDWKVDERRSRRRAGASEYKQLQDAERSALAAIHTALHQLLLVEEVIGFLVPEPSHGLHIQISANDWTALTFKGLKRSTIHGAPLEGRTVVFCPSDMLQPIFKRARPG